MNFSEAEHHAAETAPLSVDVLGRRIDHAIRAERERRLVERRREHIVDRERRARIVRDLRHLGDVDHVEVRIGRAFEKERLGVRPHRVAPLREVRAVDQRRGDAIARQEILHHVAARAEQLLRRDHMIARLHLAEQRNRHRRHAGRGRARRFGALERRHARLEHRDRRIGEARILVARLLVLEAPLGLRGRLVDIALRQEQRLGGLAEFGAQDAGLNETCLGPVVRRRHVCLLATNKKPGLGKSQMPGRGSRVPGLLAPLFNVAASRPAQMTTG